MLEAWINAEVPVAISVPADGPTSDKKMVPPVVMATATWSSVVNNAPTCNIDTPAGNTTINEGGNINYTGTATDSNGTIASYFWSFPGGSPTMSTDGNPGSVTYSTVGNYTTTFTATDNDGASCEAAIVGITVNENAILVCSDYQDKTACSANLSCEWTGKGKNAFCQDVPIAPPPSACDILGQDACGLATDCRWSKKDAICLTK